MVKLTTKCYANSRGGIIKNCGCLLKWHNFTIAYLYAIVDSRGSMTAVKTGGILARNLRDRMETELIDFISAQEDDCEHPRSIIWNRIDTPI